MVNLRAFGSAAALSLLLWGGLAKADTILPGEVVDASFTLASVPAAPFVLVQPGFNTNPFPVATFTMSIFDAGNNLLLSDTGSTGGTFFNFFEANPITTTSYKIELSGFSGPLNLDVINVYFSTDQFANEIVAHSGPAFGPSIPVDGLKFTISAAVPEPATWAMMLLGFAGLGLMGFRHRRRDAGMALAA